ncbi:MAG: peptide-methionine (S)-S-oxide reductase MsrA [Micrococcaceae bacterium]
MKSESIVLGGGCFWCLDPLFSNLKGVTDVTCGYAGGAKKNPTYYSLTEDDSTHAEVVKVTYNPETISLETILEIFWTMHDPTTLNRQGNDVGPQYRSIVLYQDENQLKAVNKSIDKVAKKLWGTPLTTEIVPLEVFWPAEDEHQDYFEKHPNQAFCQLVINPKINKLKQKFQPLLKGFSPS